MTNDKAEMIVEAIQTIMSIHELQVLEFRQTNHLDYDMEGGRWYDPGDPFLRVQKEESATVVTIGDDDLGNELLKAKARICELEDQLANVTCHLQGLQVAATAQFVMNRFFDKVVQAPEEQTT